MSSFVAVLAGRWVSVRDGEKDALVVIKDDGFVTIMGEAEDTEVRLVQVEDSASKFNLQVNGEQYCTVTLEEAPDDGKQVLKLENESGYREIWHRTNEQDGTPKIVPRRGKGNIVRRWTKEGQIGTDVPEPTPPVTATTDQ
mmetsp:Transcript_71249/g.112857  ORF Transcript_71249/g.112857 Transcript_71249/m.112857 type:complete len:141 (+) Transcript_71249:80-502(+)